MDETREDRHILLETAKLAEEKGFDIPCDKLYVGNDIEVCDPYDRCKCIQTKEHPLAPTQSFLQKWIREKHGIHMVIIPTITGNWTYKTVTVISERDNDYISGIKDVSDLPPYNNVCGYDFSTYENCLEDALVESLKMINL